MKRLVALLLPVLILLGFALLYRQEETPQKGDALVYLLAEEGSAGSDAIAGFYVDLGLTEDAAPREQAEASVLLSLESTQSHMSALGRGELLHGHVASVEEVLQGYEAVTPETVRDLARDLFRFDRASLSAVGRVQPEEVYRAILA